jgi:hypothetical protein
MNQQHRIFYKCETCLRESLVQETCHEHLMIQVDAGIEGDEVTQPVMDEAGHLLSHAPRWWTYRRRRADPHRIE